MRLILFDGKPGLERLDRIHTAMVKAGPVNKYAFADACNMKRTNAANHLYTLHEIMRVIHIVDWRVHKAAGVPLAVYAWGKGKSVPKPEKPVLTRTEQRNQLYAKNPKSQQRDRVIARRRYHRRKKAADTERGIAEKKREVHLAVIESNLERLRTAKKRAHRGPFAALFMGSQGA
jgi:hypothetical protein